MNKKIPILLGAIIVLLLAIFIAIVWKRNPEETKKVSTEMTTTKKLDNFSESVFVRDTAKRVADEIIADLTKGANTFKNKLSALESSIKSKGDTAKNQRYALIDIKYNIDDCETEIRYLQYDKTIFHTLSDGKVKSILKEYAAKKDLLLQKAK